MSAAEAQVVAAVFGVLAVQAAVLVGAWRFVVWVRGLVREETGPIRDRLAMIEERLERMTCRAGDCQ